MSRSIVLRSLTTAAAILLPLFFLGGCGSDANLDPVNPAPASDGSQFYLNDGGAAGPLALGSKDGKAPKDGASEAEDGASATGGAISVSATIDGAQGGVITNGRYRLIFPAGAFPGTQTITIEDPCNGYVECHLYPEGLTFAKQVKLQVSLIGTTGMGEHGATIYWYDPVAGSWVDIGGSYAAPVQSVVARLDHFSIYRSGRAGW